MTLQQRSDTAASNIERIKADMDRMSDIRYGRATQTGQDLKRPGHGMPQRDAVNSVIDSLSSHICDEVAQLHAQLDLIAQRALTCAAEQKHQLNLHITVFATLHDEVAHIRTVVAELGHDT